MTHIRQDILVVMPAEIWKERFCQRRNISHAYPGVSIRGDIFMLDCFLKKKERVNNDNSTLIEF